MIRFTSTTVGPSARVPAPVVALTIALAVVGAACGGADDRADQDARLIPQVTVPVPGPEHLSREEMSAVLELAGWPEAIHPEALRVAGCESAWNPKMLGDAGEYGLFQIHPWHVHRFHQTFGERADPWSPVQNAVVAREIWSELGWAPWTCQPAAVAAP